MILVLSMRIYIRILIYDFIIIYYVFYQDLDLWFCYYLLWFLSGSGFRIVCYIRWFISGSWFMILLLYTGISIMILIYDFAIIYYDFYHYLYLWFCYYLRGFLSGSLFMICVLSTRISIKIFLFFFIILLLYTLISIRIVI